MRSETTQSVSVEEPRRRDSSHTVALLKAAATEQLIASGFSGMSIKPILDKAGISRGGLFHHFPTKNHLIAAAFRDLLVDFANALANSGAELRRGDIDLETFVRQTVDTFCSDMFIGSIEISLGIRVEPELTALVADAVIEWRQALAAFWTDTFDLPGLSEAEQKQHWAMASNLLRGHAFTSTYGVEAGAREAFCQSFEKLILDQAQVKPDAGSQ